MEIKILGLRIRDTIINCYRQKRYSIPFRINDVIALITVLSVDQDAFRTEKGISIALRNEKPISANTWLKIGDEHPEFFRSSLERDLLALLLRSYFEQENDKRKPLSVDETQKMIDVAITLHQNELRERQKRSEWAIPILTALIAALAVCLSSYNSGNKNSAANDKIDVLLIKISSLERNLINGKK